jgi:membrane protein YqaA with SNARE-associated domain
MLNFTLSADWGLAGLFVSSFLAATVLPGGSEFALFAVVRAYPGEAHAALLLATLGNTLGGMSTYFLGRLLRAPGRPDKLAWVQRFGSPILLLSWVPLVGDALCLAAGWLRIHWLWSLTWMALGKGARYLAVLSLERLF